MAAVRRRGAPAGRQGPQGAPPAGALHAGLHHGLRARGTAQRRLVGLPLVPSTKE